jgi:nucleoside-diphosphate-sugar epimerase
VHLSEVRTADEVRDFMTTPTEALVELMGRLSGDILVAGAGGKVGPELVETIMRADRSAGARRRVSAVSLFWDPRAREHLQELGADVLDGDLSERRFLEALPGAPFVVYMAGVKFGTAGDWRNAFHLNCIVPYLAGERFRESSIVVFSSGNPYPLRRPAEGGCAENVPLAPRDVYGWSIVARESAFATTALCSPQQRLCLFRLQYAQHLCYGVLVDLAGMIWAGEPISLAVPAVNLVSQRDAIDVAIRALGRCANPAFVLNCGGPAALVRDVAERMARLMGREPRFGGPEGEAALLADDSLCVRTFGPRRDSVDNMVEAAARWVMAGGETWGKPTLFGRVGKGY